MGVWDKIKNIVNIPDDDYYDDMDDEISLYDTAKEEKKSAPRREYPTSLRGGDTSVKQRSSLYRERSSAATESQDRTSARSSRYTAHQQSTGTGKVVDIHTTAKLQVVLRSPERFDDAPDIADDLNEKRTVVLNLDRVNRDDAARLVAFLYGVAYANGGQLKRIAANTFIITPYNVDVMGDLLDELESNGVFFGK